MTDKVLEALELAKKLHAGQTRKGKSIPYFSHLLGVASIAMEYGADETETIAAILHDVLEDCYYPGIKRDILQRFGVEVLRIVEHCTKDKGDPDLVEYFAGLREGDKSILLVAMADKLHNARCILADLRAEGPETLERFRGGGERVMDYYRQLFLVFLKAPVPEGLKIEFASVVDAMEAEYGQAKV